VTTHLNVEHSHSTLSLSESLLVSQLFTLRDYLRWVSSEFYLAGLHYGHGTDSAWDEAVALCLGALHLPWNIDPSVLEARLLPVERQRIIAWRGSVLLLAVHCLTCSAKVFLPVTRLALMSAC